MPALAIMKARSPIEVETQAANAPPPPFQFTLRGLLLVVLAISVILAIGVPLFRMAHREGERMHCRNNLKIIAVALESYHATWKSLPPVITTDASGKPMHSWRMRIWPFLQSHPKHLPDYRWSEPWNSPNNRKLAPYSYGLFHCPADRRTKPEMTNYVAIYGPGTAWDVNKTTRLADIVGGDGMSETILIVEIRDSDIHWMEPRDIHIKDLKFTFNAKDGPSLGSYHVEGAMIAKADGSVHLLSADEIAERLKDMLTIAGGEPRSTAGATPRP